MKRITLLLFILVTCLSVDAQQILSVEEAVQIALEKNYNILLARNEGLIARTNNTVGNAGMLPDIEVNANWNETSKYDRSKRLYNNEDFIDSRPISSILGANIQLNWTIFDGGKMFIAKNRLSEVQALGEVRFRNQVLQTITDVTSAYFTVVKLKQQLVSIEQTIMYNRERMKIAETGFNSGARKKTDLLQAKIDLNVNLENAITQQALILSAKRELAELLANGGDTLFEVIDSIKTDYAPDTVYYKQMLSSKNSSILAFEKQLEIERLMLKERYRTLLPRLNFSTGFYSQRLISGESGAGQTLLTYSNYPQVGLNLSVPVFQSGDLRRNIQISKIGVESAQYDLDKLKLQVNTELLNALTLFNNQQQLLEIERENYLFAKENLEISLARMRLGETTSLEVRTAQSDFENSATRLVNFQYNLKMAETKLKQLMGDL